jgi:hypothetical protein
VKPDAGLVKQVIHHQQWRMKRAWRKMSQRIRNRVKEFHYKYAWWLCMNYQLILLPHFDTRNRVLRGLRRM